MKMLCIILLQSHGFLFHRTDETVSDISLQSHLIVPSLQMVPLPCYLIPFFIFNSCISFARASLNTSTRLLLLEYRHVASYRLVISRVRTSLESVIRRICSFLHSVRYTVAPGRSNGSLVMITTFFP